ncbi:MAG: type II secretion system major pseudopilin GspG [Candidatus Aminicenantales bacterium]|jgi:general secretion pathway protein G
MKKNNRALAKGFTLIEILIVVVIIGLLASLVGPSLFKKVGTSRQKTAMAQISMLETALKTFRLDVGRYPTTEEGMKALVTKPEGLRAWDGPYLEKDLPFDPWGNLYLYKCPGEKSEYEIVSFGADGKAGGEGENRDIFSWEVR